MRQTLLSARTTYIILLVFAIIFLQAMLPGDYGRRIYFAYALPVAQLAVLLAIMFTPWYYLVDGEGINLMAGVRWPIRVKSVCRWAKIEFVGVETGDWGTEPCIVLHSASGADEYVVYSEAESDTEVNTAISAIRQLSGAPVSGGAH